MYNDIIIISEYCREYRIEPAFLEELNEIGLIDLLVENGEFLLPSGQMSILERLCRLHYELSINVEGLDAINNMLTNMEHMQTEIKTLRKRLSLYEPLDDDEF